MVLYWYYLHNARPLKPEYIAATHAKTVDRLEVANGVLPLMLD